MTSTSLVTGMLWCLALYAGVGVLVLWTVVQNREALTKLAMRAAELDAGIKENMFRGNVEGEARRRLYGEGVASLYRLFTWPLLVFDIVLLYTGVRLLEGKTKRLPSRQDMIEDLVAERCELVDEVFASKYSAEEKKQFLDFIDKMSPACGDKAELVKSEARAGLGGIFAKVRELSATFEFETPLDFEATGETKRGVAVSFELHRSTVVSSAEAYDVVAFIEMRVGVVGRKGPEGPEQHAVPVGFSELIVDFTYVTYEHGGGEWVRDVRRETFQDELAEEIAFAFFDTVDALVCPEHKALLSRVDLNSAMGVIHEEFESFLLVGRMGDGDVHEGSERTYAIVEGREEDAEQREKLRQAVRNWLNDNALVKVSGLTSESAK